MFTAMPLLAPRPSTLLPISAPTFSSPPSDQQSVNTTTNGPNPRARKPPPTTPHPNSLAALTLDERLIDARKTAIALYGASWLRPAGCAKTMLGRREEELEREEVERQLREAEEMERLAQLEEAAAAGAAPEVEGERDLDEDVPDADAVGNAEDETTMGLGEGETGITDEVAVTTLGNAGGGGNVQAVTALPRLRAEFDRAEQDALADAMLDEDEQGMAERDLDEGVPEAEQEERDLDDDVPDVDDDEGEWQHTDTEEEDAEEEEEEGMDISGLGQTQAQASGVTLGQGVTPELSTGGSARRWFSGGARRNLFGRGSGNLFGLTPPQQPMQQEIQQAGEQQGRRRSARRGLGGENRVRDSLD